MPEPSYLAIALIFGSIGVGYFLYGRKQKHAVAFYTGIALVAFPYFISGTAAMIIVGVCLMLIPRIIKL